MDLSLGLKEAACSSRSGITFVNGTGSEERLSYRELYEGALQVLGGLQQKGLQPGDELVIQVGDSKGFLLAFWACILGRIIAVPLTAGTRGQHEAKVLRILKYLSRPYLLCDEGQLSMIRAAGISTGLIVSPEIYSCRVSGKEAVITASDIAYIQFSSGSTGDPKGVVLTHANLVCNITDIISSLRIKRDDLLLNWMPLTHDMGMIGFHLTGIFSDINTVCIPTPAFIRRPLLWMESASRHQATVCYSPNFGLHYFMTALERKPDNAWDLSGIRLIVNGAEPISFVLCQKFTASLGQYGLPENCIVAAYGLAEASVEVASTPVAEGLICHYLDRRSLRIGDRVLFVEAASDMAVCHVDVGYPVGNCQLRICGLENTQLHANVLGEIQIRGGNVTSGYYNNAQANEALLTEDGWLRTGDIGFMREGRLVITGRLKNMMILNGQNYYPADIERAIVEDGIAGYGKVAACGCPGGDHHAEMLVVFVAGTGADGALTVIADAIRETVWEKIGIQTGRVIPVRRIPKTTSGKIMHFDLIERYLKGEFGDGADRRDPIDGAEGPEDGRREDMEMFQAMLTGWIREILGQNEVDEDGNLFEMGLDSLTAIQLTNRIYRSTQKHIPIGSLFQYCTVRGICGLVGCISRADEPVRSDDGGEAAFLGLSLAQRRIWRECRFYGDWAAYHIPVVHHMKGSVDAGLLGESMRLVIGRHEILRTSFVVAGDEPMQEVHVGGEAGFCLEYTDLRGWDDRLQKAGSVVGTMVNSPFDLERPSQLRTALIRLEENEYWFVFVIHHILADGWSLGMLFREISIFYNSLAEGVSPSAIHEHPMQFGSYVDWQRKLLSTDVLAGARRYWLNELKDLPEPADLPNHSKNRMLGRRIRTESYCHLISGESVKLLRKLSLQFETSPFAILMSLINVLLYRYTNQKDIVVGFDVSGRVSEEMERMAGYTLNTLCLRVRLDEGNSFAMTVAEVKEKLYMALEHQLYPFELLVDDLPLEKSGIENPFFRVLVLYQNFYKEDFTLHNSTAEMIRGEGGISDGYVDLLLAFSEVNEGLRMDIQFDVSLYGLPVIRRFASHLENLLVSVSGDVHRKIGEYDYFSEGERAAILALRSGEIVADVEDVPVHLLFERNAFLSPDAIAVEAAGHCLSYKELNDRANAIACSIRKRGDIAPDDRIGFFVGRNTNMLIPMLAILKCGAAFVALDAEFPAFRCEAIVTDSGARYLLVENATMAKLSETFPSGILINIDDMEPGADVPGNPAWTGQMSDLAYVIYTSGSTGKPKGVMIEHRSLSAYVKQFVTYFSIGREDVVLQQSSVTFDTMVEEIFPALVSCARIVISERGGRDIEELLSLIPAHKVTVVSATPLVVAEINKRADERICSLRLVISGGDLLYPAYVDKLYRKAAVYNTYGPSEATVCVSYKRIMSPEDAGSIGRPIGGSSVYILDENMRMMPVACVGEIYIEGNLARGYLGLPALTREKFISNPYDAIGRLYRTGDLGRLTDGGEIEFIGRTDLAVKVRGYRIEPEEIERTICQHASIESAVVIADRDSDQLTAFLVVRDDFSEFELRAHLGRRLPYYMIPGRIEPVPHLPLTAAGKIDRNLLVSNRGLLREDVKVAGAGRGPTQMELLLIGIWSGLLDRPGVDIADNFFALGGNSIKGTQLVNQIYRITGIEVQITDVFVHPTIWQLGILLSQLEQSRYSYIEIQ